MKKFLFVLLVIVCLGLLTGCGNNDEQNINGEKIVNPNAEGNSPSIRDNSNINDNDLVPPAFPDGG